MRIVGGNPLSENDKDESQVTKVRQRRVRYNTGCSMHRPHQPDSMTKRHPVLTRALLTAAGAAAFAYVVWSLFYAK